MNPDDIAARVYTAAEIAIGDGWLQSKRDCRKLSTTHGDG